MTLEVGATKLLDEKEFSGSYKTGVLTWATARLKDLEAGHAIAILCKDKEHAQTIRTAMPRISQHLRWQGYKTTHRIDNDGYWLLVLRRS